MKTLELASFRRFVLNLEGPKVKCSIRHGREMAFSLVEVVIALAIISVSLLTMLGLMPVGLINLRQAMDSTTEGQIVKQMTAQIRLTPFSKLDTYENVSFFYDEAGGFLTNAASVTDAPAETRFWVTALESTPTYPGCNNAPSSSPMENSSKMITLQFVSGSAVLTTNNYVVLVPNSGD